MTRQVRQPALGYARSLMTSTAFHGAVIGVGALFGLRAAVITAATPSPEPRTYSFVAELDPLELVEEFEEPQEIEIPDEPLVEPELVPVEYELDPVVYSEVVIHELPDDIPAMEAFTVVNLTPVVEPEPPVETPPEPPPTAPEPKILVVERMPPHLLEGIDPDYPRMSARLGESGSVLCILHVDAEGEVSRVEVEESSGFTRLDEAAIERLETWRFRPATLGGEAVIGTYRHRVRFELGG